MHVFRISVITAVLLTIINLIPDTLSAQQIQQGSYREYILKYVDQDKVYLLETLSARATKNAEKTIIRALLTEDGPLAARLFQKQLLEYPDPVLDPLSRARLASYASALGSTATVSPHHASSGSESGYILQFGSFGSREYAEQFAAKIAGQVPVTVFQEGSLHKVRTKESFKKRSDAESLAAKLSINSFIRQIR